MIESRPGGHFPSYGTRRWWQVFTRWQDPNTCRHCGAAITCKTWAYDGALNLDWGGPCPKAVGP